MVLGIPNVGKSTFINNISGTNKARAEDRPGITRTKQWVRISDGIDLLDMPGILWPKFDDKRVAENLAATGAVKDVILDIESVALALCKRLRKYYPELLSLRYKLGDPASFVDLTDAELLTLIGKKRGFLISGGEIDLERTSIVLLEELRSGKIGKITLDYITNP